VPKAGPPWLAEDKRRDECAKPNRQEACFASPWGMISRVQQMSRAIVLVVSCATVAYAQEPTTNDAPDNPVFRARTWGFVAADFGERVSHYVELRTSLERGSPNLAVTDDAGEIRRTQGALAHKMRRARVGARQGDIFSSNISAEFRHVLLLETNPGTMATIMDENPGDLRGINRAYPTGKPRASVPAGILALLPTLPDDLQYRFVGRALILIDTRTNLILDRMPCAIACSPPAAPLGVEETERGHADP